MGYTVHVFSIDWILFKVDTVYFFFQCYYALHYSISKMCTILPTVILARNEKNIENL